MSGKPNAARKTSRTSVRSIKPLPLTSPVGATTAGVMIGATMTDIGVDTAVAPWLLVTLAVTAPYTPAGTLAQLACVRCRGDALYQIRTIEEIHLGDGRSGSGRRGCNQRDRSWSSIRCTACRCCYGYGGNAIGRTSCYGIWWSKPELPEVVECHGLDTYTSCPKQPWCRYRCASFCQSVLPGSSPECKQHPCTVG